MTDLSVKLPKPKYGQVVVLQKNGDEPRGHGFPLISSSCVVGRSTAADIRISSADVSLTHCKFMIDEATGEASLEVHGNETEINGIVVDSVTTVKLNHKDIVLVGGRKLRFEYLPPDYKPLPSKPTCGLSSDSFNAEVVDLEENGDVVDSNAEREEEILPEVQCTPAGKRVSFGPYLSPEQFDNTLPPATPIKKGATPRRSTRYSGLKFTRSAIDPLVEEDIVLESPVKEQPDTKAKECVDETIISEDVSGLVSTGETVIVDNSLSLVGIGTEFSDLANPTNLEMSIDAMSTMSDVSNIAAVPSECCSFLDEPIEEDEFGPEVVEEEDESLTPMGDNSLFSDDLIAVEIPGPPMTTSHLTNGSELLRSFTTSSLTEKMDEEDEEGITLSPEDMSEMKNVSNSVTESISGLEEAVQGATIPMEIKDIPSSSQADQSDVGSIKQLIETPKNQSTVADDLLKNPQSVVAQFANEDVTKIIDTTPAVVVERIEQVDIIIGANIEKVMETPESSPVKAALNISSPVAESPHPAKQTVEAPLETQIALAVSPKLDTSNLEGVARLLETPKTTRSKVTAIGRTPQADYTDVRGVKKLLQTPKPPPNTPKADYRDVRGVKRLLATPKVASGTPVADYTDVEGVDLLMKTPKSKQVDIGHQENQIKVSELKEQMIEAEESSKTPIEIAETTEAIVFVEKDIEGTPLSQKQIQPEKPVIDECNSADKSIEIPSTIKEAEECEKALVAKKPVTEEESVDTSNRGRKPIAAKIDDSNVTGVERLLTSPKAAPATPQADYSDVEGIDLLMKTPKPKDVIETSEHVIEQSTTEATFDSAELTQLANKDAIENDENRTVITPPKIEDEEQKETENEKEAAPPRRGRRVASSSAKSCNTPKADHRDVSSGLKRLLRTPKAVSETPKADYTDVEGVDLLMKTPKPKDPLPHDDTDEKDVDVSERLVAEKVVEMSEIPVDSAETTEDVATVVASDVEETKTINEEQIKETEAEKDVAPLRRGRRTVAAKTPTTPKVDNTDVSSGVKRLLKAPQTAPETPKVDYSNMEGVDLLMKTPEAKESVAQTIEEHQVLAEVVSEDQSTPDVSLEACATTKEIIIKPTGESVEENTPVVPSIEPDQPSTEEEPSKIEKTPQPRRGRRLAAAAVKSNTPKADYRDVTGVERLLKTSETDVEGVDFLMKTPQVSDDNKPVTDEKVDHVANAEESIGSSGDDNKTADLVGKEDPIVTAQVEHPPTKIKEIEKVTATRRGRKIGTNKTNTPKADNKTSKRPSKTTKAAAAASTSPQADESNAEEIDLTITESDEEVKVVAIPETSPEKLVDEDKPKDVEQDLKKTRVEKEITPPRRGRRLAAAAAATPKTNTPKPVGRSKRKQPSSELNGTAEPPNVCEKEEPVVEEKNESPVQSVKMNTPKRSRRAIASTKTETVKSTQTKRASESDSGQLEEIDSRPMRSKRRKEEEPISEKLTLSPVVRLQRIDLALGANAPEEVTEVASKTGSISSGEEWGVTKEVTPVRRGRGRPAKVKVHKTDQEEKLSVRTTTRKGKAAAPLAVEEPIPSDDEVEEENVQVKSTKKTTSRRAAVKRVSIAEKEETMSEGKRRRAQTAAAKLVTGLDDVEMLHEGKGHAADIHANHMPDEPETNQASPATSTKSSRSTRSKNTLKVHFDIADSAPSPARATRSAKKASTVSSIDQQVAVVLERQHDIDTLAATVTEDESTTKRSRKKKVAPPTVDQSPAEPATKRTRGAKKTISEPELDKEATSAPPSPRRSRRTRNN